MHASLVLCSRRPFYLQLANLRYAMAGNNSAKVGGIHIITTPFRNRRPANQSHSNLFGLCAYRISLYLRLIYTQVAKN